MVDFGKLEEEFRAFGFGMSKSYYLSVWIRGFGLGGVSHMCVPKGLSHTYCIHHWEASHIRVSEGPSHTYCVY